VIQILALLCLCQGPVTPQQSLSNKQDIIIPAPTAKPPKQEYDKVRDITVCRTNETKFRTVSGFSYIAAYTYKGQDPKQPDVVWLNFYAIRNSESPDNDGDAASWANVSEVVLRWAKDPAAFPATYEKIVNKNDMMKILVGRTFYEHLKISVPVGQFYDLAHAKSVMVALGDHEDELGERTMSPMKQLSESLPEK